MRIVIRREHDLEWLREVHRFAFPHDVWPGNNNLFWVAVHPARGFRQEQLVGFASACNHGDMLELTSCAVVSAANGLGLQRRLIRVREAYARRQGCTCVCTYAIHHNYGSITNLIRAGYRFVRGYSSTRYFHFVRYL